jgi:hypothetical protein
MAKTEILNRIDYSRAAVDKELVELNFIVGNVMKNPAQAKTRGYGAKSLNTCVRIQAGIELVDESLRKWDEYTAAWEKPATNKLQEAKRLAKKVLLSDSRKKAKVRGDQIKLLNQANREVLHTLRAHLEAVFA